LYFKHLAGQEDAGGGEKERIDGVERVHGVETLEEHGGAGDHLLPQLQLLSEQLQYKRNIVMLAITYCRSFSCSPSNYNTIYTKYSDAGDHLLPQLQLLSKQLQYIRNIVTLAITCCRSFSCSPSNYNIYEIQWCWRSLAVAASADLQATTIYKKYGDTGDHLLSQLQLLSKQLGIH
jgi:hypothetical protein